MTSDNRSGSPRVYNEASDAIIEILASNGVTQLFVMPGDAFPLVEAVLRRQAAALPAPRVVTCLHEIFALAAAHGHFMVSNRPQACLFHVDVGMQMAGGMLHNAQRGRAGVVILSGRTPMTLDGSRRGGRVVDVHWMQDRQDQAGLARDYVKWSVDLYRPEPVPQVIQRALQLAASEPAGPVAVTLLREMLMEPATLELLSPDRYGPPRPSVPSEEALTEVAELIARARRPLVITGYVGRRAEGFHALGEFAQAAAIPVISRGIRANLSSDSPMYLGTDPTELLAQADLLLLLDVDVPFIPAFQQMPRSCTVVQIDIDPLKVEIPVWGFPVDVALQGDCAVALPVLTTLVKNVRTQEQADISDDRRATLSGLHDRRTARLEAGAAERASATPISVEYLAQCIANLVDSNTIVVDDSTTAMQTTSQYMPTTVPGSYFQPAGSSMGWGSGAAVGVKMASPASTVISLNAEGNFFSGVPEAALWAARRYDAPFLTVVFNNAQYAAIKLGMQLEYPEARSLKPGGPLDLDDAPNIVGIARACHAYAERVEVSNDVASALSRGLDAVQAGQAAVVDVAVAGL